MKGTEREELFLYYLILRLVTTEIDRCSILFVTIIHDTRRGLSIA